MKNPTSLARGPLLSTLAAAALLACHPTVSAFSLGRMTVQSTLGEPLRAEIDVTALTPEEAGSLKSSIAAPDAFRAAGVEFNGVLAGAQAALQRRSDGRAVIRLVGERAVTEPFIDIILDFAWSGGRLQRSYTLLIDPPSLSGGRSSGMGQDSAPITAAPSFSASPAAPAGSRQAPPPPQATPIIPARPLAVEPPAPKPVRQAARPAAPAPAPTESSGGGSYRVKAGDTLSAIAASQARAGVSLDQMLVGLFRGNPDAFLNSNVNRLKSGVVLAVPDAQTATAISTEEARQVIQAHSADFSAFRKRMAEAAPTVKTAEPERQSKGKLEAAVQDRKPGAGSAPPDELKLTRPAVKAAEPEAKISKESERKAAQSRVAELSRNVDELKKLSAGTPPSDKKSVVPASAPTAPAGLPVAAKAIDMPAKPAAAAASAPAVAASVPSVLAASAPSIAAQPASVPKPASAAAPAVPASASAPRQPKVLPPVPEPEPEPGFLESLTDNPFVLPGVVGLVALAAGLGVMRLRRRNQDQGGETSFVESKLQADSFFGVSGGQRIDTRDGGASSSSLSYSLSQLDAIGDVDPVAEADVYLAYGRDLQAEEILKEAMRSDPGRIAIRTKLMEVYVKRADTRSAEAVALQILELTGGVGEEWEKVRELGRQVDPDNGLYALASTLTAVDIDTSNAPPPDLAPEPEDGEQPAFQFTDESQAQQRREPAFQQPVYQDQASPFMQPAFDEPVSPFHQASSYPEQAPAEEVASAVQAPLSSFDLDLDLVSPPSVAGTFDSTQNHDLSSQLSGYSDHVHGLDSAMPDLLPSGYDALPELSVEPVSAGEPGAPSEPVADAGSVEFDFGDLSLDLDEPSAVAAPAVAPVPAAATPVAIEPDLSFDMEPQDGDPLLDKIELADEFRRIGDMEGAREMLEEVLIEATGSLRTRAQAMLNELG